VLCSGQRTKSFMKAGKQTQPRMINRFQRN
jgi:hypothetical protein